MRQQKSLNHSTPNNEQRIIIIIIIKEFSTSHIKFMWVKCFSKNITPISRHNINNLIIFTYYMDIYITWQKGLYGFSATTIIATIPTDHKLLDVQERGIVFHALFNIIIIYYLYSALCVYTTTRIFLYILKVCPFFCIMSIQYNNRSYYEKREMAQNGIS